MRGRAQAAFRRLPDAAGISPFIPCSRPTQTLSGRHTCPPQGQGWSPPARWPRCSVPAAAAATGRHAARLLLLGPVLHILRPGTSKPGVSRTSPRTPCRRTEPRQRRRGSAAKLDPPPCARSWMRSARTASTCATASSCGSGSGGWLCSCGQGQYVIMSERARPGGPGRLRWLRR